MLDDLDDLRFPVSWPAPPACAICWRATITSGTNGSTYLWVAANFAPAGIYRAYIPPAAHSALQQHDEASPTPAVSP